jgi:hypothetical protein
VTLYYLKDYIAADERPLFRSDRQRDLVCAAINYFGPGDGPHANASTITDFSVQCALESVGKAMAGQQGTPRGEILMEFHSRVEDALASADDTDADFYNETIGKAQDAFWATVAERYRAKGVKSGDFPPDAQCAFTEACTNAVAEWLRWNKPEHAAPITESDGDNAWGEKALKGAVITLAGEGDLPPGWTVTYEFPGYFAFCHKARSNFTILCTPDHDGADDAIAIDAQNDDGDVLRSWDNAPWPRSERIDAYQRGGCYEVARTFLKRVIPVLKECEPQKLVVEYDVTGWTDEQVSMLMGEACAQAEASDDDSEKGAHPDAPILRSEVVPFEGETT